MWLRVKSKIGHNFTKNGYFLMKFWEVVKLISSATSQSLSTNGQVWTTFRTSFGFKFHIFCCVANLKPLHNPSKTIDFHQLQNFKMNFLHEKIFFVIRVFFYIQNFICFPHSRRLNRSRGAGNSARDPALIFFRIWNRTLDIAPHLMKSSEMAPQMCLFCEK